MTPHAPPGPAPTPASPSAATHTVRLEPVGVELAVREGETVLNAAFRQGVALMHGCKEGQCASCKSLLVEGDVELLRYSTFALPDYERDTGHVLLCRALCYSDATVELLNFDEELLGRAIPVRTFAGRVRAVEAPTADIRRLHVALDEPLKFWAGQYVDITVPNAGGGAVTRAFSMASAPSAPTALEFLIRRYPGGAFSSLLDDGAGALAPGAAVALAGPFGTCFHREQRTGPLVLVGGGSGLSPLWSILRDHAERAAAGAPARRVRLFYGARRPHDLFDLDALAEVGATLPDFRFVPVLSACEHGDAWEGERGYVHEAVARHLRAEPLAAGPLGGDADAYACGPPPMIDALLPVLQMAGVEPEHLHFDRFTPAAR